jgi:hypothetical protein
MAHWWDISLDTANEFYTWGWRASMFGALITFFGVAFLYWGTRVRDHDVERNVATLNLEAGSARERAGKLEERAGQLEKDAEILKRDNLELEGYIAPRRMTVRELATMDANLAPFAGKTVRLRSYVLDAESMIFSFQFSDALLKARIRMFDRRMSEQGFTNLTLGVWITGSDEKLVSALLASIPKHIDFARGAVDTSGPGMKVVVPQDSEPVDAEIFIGVKSPNPPKMR